jgi:RND family efflux transporter MFP subunit
MGALVTVGTALVTVTAENRLEVRLGVEAAEAAQIGAGQTVTLFSVNRPGAPPIVSAVRVAGSTLDPVTGAAEVRVPVPAGAPLLTGEHVKAAVEVRKKEALVVPRSAVLPDAGKFVLFTVKNNHAVRHDVVTGISAGDLLEVSGQDLHDGDTVITLGNYELTDGMAVQPEENKQPVEQGKGAMEAKP